MIHERNIDEHKLSTKHKSVYDYSNHGGWQKRGWILRVYLSVIFLQQILVVRMISNCRQLREFSRGSEEPANVHRVD